MTVKSNKRISNEDVFIAVDYLEKGDLVVNGDSYLIVGDIHRDEAKITITTEDGDFEFNVNAKVYAFTS